MKRRELLTGAKRLVTLIEIAGEAWLIQRASIKMSIFGSAVVMNMNQ
jgi:hypothetical protein